MKNSEIKELNNKEILEQLTAEREHLVRLKLNHAITPLDNPMQIKEVRKTISRLATELGQRDINL